MTTKDNREQKLEFIEPREDIIKLSILVMESLVSTEVKEKFLKLMINPHLLIKEEETP